MIAAIRSIPKKETPPIPTPFPSRVKESGENMRAIAKGIRVIQLVTGLSFDAESISLRRGS